MPQFRYDGPAHVFKKSEDDKGTLRGEIGSFSQELVDRYTNPKQGQMQHRFTKASDLSAGAVEDAKDVEPHTALPTVGFAGGVDETRIPATKK